MARGLSYLQKQILCHALANRGELSNREALARIYKFPVKRGRGNGFFSPSRIGTRRYRSATVAVAKSFNRLARRGLAHRQYNCGILLTPQGRRAAKSFKL